MERATISVIITTYNRPDYLEQAISSVAEQSFQPLEILVIDDGSTTDYATAICQKYQNCYCHRKDNGGISSARNHGMELAKGDWIAFLDDDDYWKPEKLEKQLAVAIEDDNLKLIHAAVAVVDGHGNLTGKILGASDNKVAERSGHVFWRALGVWIPKSPTPLLHRSLLDAGLRFDESLVVGEDIDFYQRSFYGSKVAYIHQPLAFYRVAEGVPRLSDLKEKYIGVDWKMYQNFKAMGINNPLVLYKIARKLYKAARRRMRGYGPVQESASQKLLGLVAPARRIKQLSTKS